MASHYPELTAAEAAEMIDHNAFIGVSGFTPAGAAKAIPRAMAKKAIREHEAGREYQVRILSGASTGSALDEELARANAISWRAPYQSSNTLRKSINEQNTEFIEMHLSHVGQMLEFGFFGDLDVGIVEATDVTPDGRVYLTSSGGISPTVLQNAKRVFIEINDYHSPRLSEMHDVKILPRPPKRSPIPIETPLTKIGTPYAVVDPKRVVGIVRNNEGDGVSPATSPDEVSLKIADHIVNFLLAEMAAGRIPPEFLPLQAGVGNVANAVLGNLGVHPKIPPFYMFTEVFQDSQVALMQSGRLLGASTSSLTLSEANMKTVYNDMNFWAPRLVIRPTELSNNPGVIRRLGVIAINTVLEMDIYGCANSTHVCGTQLMNGIGGSGDFVRNSYLSILVAPSIAKNGAISAVVPMCSHVDHNEHSVQILVTEQGLADLRGLGPIERAKKIIDTCAHPMYRDYLRGYIAGSRNGHLRHDLGRAFELHQNFLQRGHMLPQG